MGGGSYSYISSSSRTASRATMDSVEIFTQRKMDEQMNIKGKIRECCETEEHPETFPIIIGLDVTGSMGHVPTHLIKSDFPEVMKKILDAGIPCPQVCFCAFGDALDSTPIQVGQFEANDELMEKWLTLTYLEGGGRGNGHEDPELIWYFAAHHTACDAFKRGKKGLIITVSDEAIPSYLRKEDIAKNFGDYVGENLDVSVLLEQVKENWEVYHINLEDYIGKTQSTKASWDKLLGDHVKHVPDNDTNVSTMIADIAITVYNEQYGKSNAINTDKDNIIL